jgi:murein L,D-transpeptidase YcbB/YkuD
MKSVGFTITTILLIGLLGAGGYFAVKGLTDPADYLPKESETIGDLHKITTEPQTGTKETPIATVPTATASATTPNTSTTAPTVTTSTDLKTNIQTLITNKTTLKIGSKGPAVGYIQQFMNLYFKKALKVDNDYGKTLEANVKAFQKATGVTQTGQIGPATLAKMLEWLQKNPQ